MTGARMREWEVEALRRMDGLRLARLNASKDEATVSSRPMTPKLFAGLFGGKR